MHSLSFILIIYDMISGNRYRYCSPQSEERKRNEKEKLTSICEEWWDC